MEIRVYDGPQKGELIEVPFEVAQTLIARDWAIDVRNLMKLEILSGPQAGQVVEVENETGLRLVRSGQARAAADDAPALPYEPERFQTPNEVRHAVATPEVLDAPVLRLGESGGIVTDTTTESVVNEARAESVEPARGRGRKKE